MADALYATLRTSAGPIRVQLFPDHAPRTVRNFVELAEGKREYTDPRTGSPGSGPFYDGTVFHRVIAGFMIQAGDPTGTGRGGPGYQFDDEISDLVHQPGTLAYANAGPDTNGSQFYVTEVTTDWLDGSFTIIGSCEPMSVIEALTAVDTDSNDEPVTPVHTLKVSVTRCAP